MSEHTQQDVLSVFSTAPAVWLIRRVCVNGEMWEVCSECREADFPALKLSKSEQFTAHWVILSMISQPCRDSEHPGWCPNNRR